MNTDPKYLYFTKFEDGYDGLGYSYDMDDELEPITYVEPGMSLRDLLTLIERWEEKL